MDLESPRSPAALPSPSRRREAGTRSALVAFASTIVFVAVLVVVVARSEAWPAVQRQFFNPEVFVDSWPIVVSGFWLDLQMFAIAEVLILSFALLLASIRSLRGPA